LINDLLLWNDIMENPIKNIILVVKQSSKIIMNEWM